MKRAFAAAMALYVENEGFKLLGHSPGLRFPKSGREATYLILTPCPPSFVPVADETKSP